ncbi:hypothetical protein [Flammeovirga aprica]|uniref:Uncharacterized protein n=1 Tax=Flammeovirga aprica JL-4 TaxID=694437 RepID=A0A7X9XD65_9BACT|nr:hypothetical protein [Flammeovirga aprica]NME72463.1 hypothetical protein [Flammeovirga aprica JL-4]
MITKSIKLQSILLIALTLFAFSCSTESSISLDEPSEVEDYVKFELQGEEVEFDFQYSFGFSSTSFRDSISFTNTKELMHPDIDGLEIQFEFLSMQAHSQLDTVDSEVVFDDGTTIPENIYKPRNLKLNSTYFTNPVTNTLEPQNGITTIEIYNNIYQGGVVTLHYNGNVYTSLLPEGKSRPNDFLIISSYDAEKHLAEGTFSLTLYSEAIEEYITIDKGEFSF